MSSNETLTLTIEEMQLFPDTAGRDLHTDPVLSFDPRWTCNADMIKDLNLLRYFDGPTLDMTYGLGNFWTTFKPVALIRNDLHPSKGDTSFDWTRHDFHTKFEQRFDTVVFDPPYKTQGTPNKNDDGRYGTDKTYTAAELKESITAGIINGTKCVNGRGLFMIKSQTQQSSGWLFDQTLYTHNIMTKNGFKKIAVMQLLNTPPKQSTQKTPRNNLSQLSIFRKTTTT